MLCCVVLSAKRGSQDHRHSLPMYLKKGRHIAHDDPIRKGDIGDTFPAARPVARSRQRAEKHGPEEGEGMISRRSSRREVDCPQQA